MSSEKKGKELKLDNFKITGDIIKPELFMSI